MTYVYFYNFIFLVGSEVGIKIPLSTPPRFIVVGFYLNPTRNPVKAGFSRHTWVGSSLVRSGLVWRWLPSLILVVVRLCIKINPSQYIFVNIHKKLNLKIFV